MRAPQWRGWGARAAAALPRRGLRAVLTLELAALAVVALLAWQNGLGALDLLLSDFALRHSGRPPAEQIIIVAIDQRTLERLGRWPWQRQIHARLVERVGADAPAAIGLDIVFSEADPANPAGDTRLAQAMRAAGKVVLPVSMYVGANGAPQAELPLAELVEAAGALGHVHYEVSSDGLVRGVFLREGLGASRWNHLALAMLAVAGRPLDPARLPGLRAPERGLDGAGPADDAWRRDHWMRIAFAGPPRHFHTVSYLDVLEGRVAPGLFKGKLVLVGATASGMGDQFPTPVSGQVGAMAGVELSANLLGGILDGAELRPAAPWQNVLFNLLPVAAGLLLWRRCSPRHALLTAALLSMIAPLVALVVQMRWGLCFAPAVAIRGVFVCYMLWGWRRQETALAFLSEEYLRARQGFPLAPGPAGEPGGEDFLGRRVGLVRAAAQKIRSLHAFVHGALNNLPDAVLVTDGDGAVVLVNEAGLARLGHLGQSQPIGQCTSALLARVLPAAAEVLPDLREARRAFAVETAWDRDCDLLIKGVPRYDDAEQFAGWILTLIDIGDLRLSQRQHDEALRFISHDIRSPQASILTLIEMQRRGPVAPGQEPMLTRIESLARRSLALADDFLYLARAESGSYRLDQVDLADLLVDAADQLWVAATAKGIRVRLELPETPAQCLLEPALLTRAIANLLGNAIKFSPRDSEIVCCLSRSDTTWCIGIRDQGAGIAAADLSLLFKKFSRLRPDGGGRVEGAGLGLCFVKTVVEQHHGEVAVSSEVNQGSEFRIVLPAGE